MENEEDRMETDKLIATIKPDHVGMNVFVGIPGSELYDYVRKNKLYEYEDSNHVLYIKGHNRLVDMYYNGNPYLKIPSATTRRKILAFELKNRAIGLYGQLRKILR